MKRYFSSISLYFLLYNKDYILYNIMQSEGEKMRLMTPSHCRAARGLLNWSQAELARRCRMHKQTISNFEADRSTPSKQSLDTMMRIFDIAGVDLLPQGVKRKEQIYVEVKGQDRLIRLIEDVYENINTGDEVLIDGAIESITPDFVLEKVQWLRDQGIKMRHLIKEGDRNLRAPLKEYRWIPKQFFTNQPIFIYGENSAIFSNTEENIIIFRDKNLTNYFCNIFNERWTMYKQPDYSTAKNKFNQ